MVEDCQKRDFLIFAASREPMDEKFTTTFATVCLSHSKHPTNIAVTAFVNMVYLQIHLDGMLQCGDPFHMIGLETNTSIMSAVLRNEPTGASCLWKADAVATAKRDLAAGEMLDGEGGFCVWPNLFLLDCQTK